jgi:hypothetical protein
MLNAHAHVHVLMSSALLPPRDLNCLLWAQDAPQRRAREITRIDSPRLHDPKKTAERNTNSNYAANYESEPNLIADAWIRESIPNAGASPKRIAMRGRVLLLAGILLLGHAQLIEASNVTLTTNSITVSEGNAAQTFAVQLDSVPGMFPAPTLRILTPPPPHCSQPPV